VDDFGARLRKVIGAVSQSDMLLKKKSHNGEPKGLLRSRKKICLDVWMYRCIATTTITTALQLYTACSTLYSRHCLRFQSSKVFSPPRGRSENHAVRPLDRPVRSRDFTNIGGWRLRNIENLGLGNTKLKS